METSCWKFVRERSQRRHLGKRKEGSRPGQEVVGLTSSLGSSEAALVFPNFQVALRGQGLYTPESTARLLIGLKGNGVPWGTIAFFSPCNP